MTNTEKKRTLTLKDGTEVVIPIIGKEDITVGLRRKTRHLSEQEAQEEILWLLLEKLLTEEECNIIDNLVEEQFVETVKAVFEYDPKELNS